MKLKGILISIAFILLMGCARQAQDMDAYQGDPFYFSVENVGVYKYSGAITKMSSDSIHSMKASRLSKNLFLSTSSALNILNRPGNIFHRYENDHNLTAATLSKDESIVYFSNTKGELFKYNVETTQKTKIDVNQSIYPLPRQMVFDEENNHIYYHDQFYIYEIDIVDKTKRRLTNRIISIASLAYNSKNGKIYFSSSTNGKIYKLSIFEDYFYTFHETISVNGALISMNEDQNKLLFSKSNGKDTFIKTIDVDTKDVRTVKVLTNIKRVSQLSY